MRRTAAAALILLLSVFNVNASVFDDEPSQTGTVELRGLVLDETGAYIPAVAVEVDDGKGNKYKAETDERGRYRVRVLPGVYTVRVAVPGFANFEGQVDLSSGRPLTFDVKMTVEFKEQVEIKENTANISTDPDKNLSSITLTEADIESLPDDPDELLETLRQLAGAGAGDEAAIYVGGFRERGRMPPRESIQMIRINSNPFSAEFSEVGFSRIEIITKPGSDQMHGGGSSASWMNL